MKRLLLGALIGIVAMLALGGGLVAGKVVALGEEDIPPHEHSSIACYDNVAASATHSHTMRMLTDEDTIPTVEIAIIEDAMIGYNVQIDVTDFTFAPQHASSEYVDGEGHAHLYIDGVKIGRVYGEWVYVGELNPGLHEIKVTLNGNDHSMLMADGLEIADAVVIAVE